MKFSPDGSTVRVTLEAGPRVATLLVDDEGSGVPEPLRENVFERFRRADDARALPGSGLGLAIVQDAVVGHGGTVALTQAPGGGCRVVIELPGAPPASR